MTLLIRLLLLRRTAPALFGAAAAPFADGGWNAGDLFRGGRWRKGHATKSGNAARACLAQPCQRLPRLAEEAPGR